MIICDWCHGKGPTKRITVTVQDTSDTVTKFMQTFQVCETCQSFLMSGIKESATPPLACVGMRANVHECALNEARKEARDAVPG